MITGIVTHWDRLISVGCYQIDQISQAPLPVYTLPDEVTGTPYDLISRFANLKDYVGLRVTITGTPVAGDPDDPPS